MAMDRQYRTGIPVQSHVVNTSTHANLAAFSFTPILDSEPFRSHEGVNAYQNITRLLMVPLRLHNFLGQTWTSYRSGY